VHGKASVLEHDGAGPFAGLHEPLRVGRYHSLCTRDIPARFTVHGSIDGMAMGISDPAALQTGLQFHPESILSPVGHVILKNVLQNSARGSAAAAAD
jgi:anthranilate/para-aminobenzoate synthase component II